VTLGPHEKEKDRLIVLRLKDLEKEWDYELGE